MAPLEVEVIFSKNSRENRTGAILDDAGRAFTNGDDLYRFLRQTFAKERGDHRFKFGSFSLDDGGEKVEEIDVVFVAVVLDAKTRRPIWASPLALP